MLGLGWFRMKKQISAFSEFCNVCLRPVFFKFSGKSILMPLHRGAPRAPTHFDHPPLNLLFLGARDQEPPLEFATCVFPKNRTHTQP